MRDSVWLAQVSAFQVPDLEQSSYVHCLEIFPQRPGAGVLGTLTESTWVISA